MRGDLNAMNINELIEQKNLTKYRLSKESGIPFSTLSEICSGKAKIEKCAADTVYKLSHALGVTMEDLIADRMIYRPAFENFKSNVCHRVHDMGDMDFIIGVLEIGEIRTYYQRGWYLEALYLLAMVDYISRENDIPICADYNDIRAAKLKSPVYPASILTLCAATHSDAPKVQSRKEAISEFMRFNIVESEVRNVI
jgi:transcriptional regulator with XRE-family HTH domain